MGIFGSVFGNKGESAKEEKIIPWIPLTSVEQLDEIAEKSKTRTQLIFKHSTTCGISRMVLNMFTGSYSLSDEQDIYFLDLHAHRDVSNEVQYKFQVMHQSPQLLIIKNGEVTYHTSHGAIADTNLLEYI
ncbi:bacillithiol system redox-active protein YtxJ [Flagellimonas aquimarina]|jgi:bacillithiol system protein YtxJ|uniref:Bacillithiol system redox-active protein YtxJ n=1 Tax=Flagellimonas aquimarina TaxID=2201895 RepID=A0A316L026_9FLAO|nr:bacillithiol system redox-active protein YtxJ [Allomuricauda koreensis]PWL38658.1 bacillithiol system redox-active protein YtxJ [Allomuricauda koreensis]